MTIAIQRWGPIALILPALLAFPAVGQVPEPPPFNRSAVPGDPPPVPGDSVPGDKDKFPVPTPDTGGAEVEGRGNIHEGFAQPGSAAPRPNPVVPREPPKPITETPPDEKPEGDNVVWIPGYWGWDEDRSDYVWVSGFWRVLPAGRKWVPGYWTKADGGWRWVSGLWAPANQPAVPYSEPPPETLERGPSVPQPGEDYSYVPGTWAPLEDQWTWQPGFWCAPRPGFVYCPPRWNWTPAGCLYTAGFWDRCLETRGVLYAPVYFPGQSYLAPGFCYRPSYCLGIGGALGCLWVRPSCGYYAFGDFYGARYGARGYAGWANYGPRFRDPLYGYYRVANRGNPGWRNGLVNTYDARTRGTLAVPPRTFSGRNAALVRSSPVVQPISSYRNDRLRIGRASPTDLAAGQRVASAYREAAATRQTIEGRVPATGARREALPLARIPAGKVDSGRQPSVSAKVPAPGLSPARPPAARPTEATRPPAATPPREGRLPRSEPGREPPRVTVRPPASSGRPATSAPAPTPPRGTPRDLPPTVPPATARPQQPPRLPEQPPRALTPPPRVSVPQPTPRVTMPQPQPAPRITMPQAPRFTPPSPPRMAPPAPAAPRMPAPRPSSPPRPAQPRGRG